MVTSFTLRNTIVANNGAQECMHQNGVSATGSGNLIVQNSGCPGAVVALDPQLGFLQLNAPGSTPTMAIDSSITGSGNFNCIGTGPVVCTKQAMTRGEIDALTLTVIIPAGFAKGESLKNSVSVTSATPDPNLLNNSATVPATVQ